MPSNGSVLTQRKHEINYLLSRGYLLYIKRDRLVPCDLLPTLPTLPLCQLYFSLNADQWLVFTRHMIYFIEKIQLAKLAKWQSCQKLRINSLFKGSVQIYHVLILIRLNIALTTRENLSHTRDDYLGFPSNH